MSGLFVGLCQVTAFLIGADHMFKRVDGFGKFLLAEIQMAKFKIGLRIGAVGFGLGIETRRILKIVFTTIGRCGSTKPR